VLAIEFGACGQNVCFVDSVNDELHRKPPAGGSVYWGTCVPPRPGPQGFKARPAWPKLGLPSKLAPPLPPSASSQERAVAGRRRRAGAVLGLHSTTWLPFCIRRDRTCPRALHGLIIPQWPKARNQRLRRAPTGIPFFGLAAAALRPG